MNTLEIRNEFEGLTGIKVEDIEGSQVTTSQFLRWLNAGEVKFSDLADCIEGVSYLTTITGTAEYLLPTTTMKIWRVKWNDEKIYPTTIDRLDGYNVNWNDDSGSPTNYYIRKMNEDKILGLYPNPSTAQDLRIYFTKTPTAITTLDISTYPEIRGEWHMALPHFCAAMYYMRMQESVELRSRSAGHMDIFLGFAARAKMSTVTDNNDEVLVWGGEGLDSSGGLSTPFGLGSTIRFSDFS